MYEISLVPDVKAELIKKLKMRNLVIFICIMIGVGCGVLMMILAGYTGAQGIAMSAQDKELACRSTGEGKCESKYGTAIMNFENGSDLLTIQGQMKDLEKLNQGRVKITRLFNILDTIRLDMNKGDENTIRFSEVAADIDSSAISFDANAYASNGIHYRALEAFKKNAERTYIDYGSYMRQDAETGELVKIPSFCIDEEKDERGLIIGVYHRGEPGCEAPMVEEKSEEKKGEEKTEENEEKTVEGEGEVEGGDEDKISEDDVKKQIIKKDIRIRRTYSDASDFANYLNGEDKYALPGAEPVKGYVFVSECLMYDENGKFSEEGTLQACPLLSADVAIGDSSIGRDSDEQTVLQFQTSLSLNRDVFLASNTHMIVVSPIRRNVTDSYIQIDGMFTAAAHKSDEEGN